MTPRYTRALTFGATVHEGQVRKGTGIPYIVHPVSVAGLIAQFGGDEDQQIAGLLHDVLEDGGPEYASLIELDFGPRVLRLVRGATDGVPDSTGRKLPWRLRKEGYIEHLANAEDELLLVTGCDKLHNARSIVEDLESIGLSVFDRFTGKLEGTIWYYQTLDKLFALRNAPMHAELSATVHRMLRIVFEKTGRLF